MKTKLLKIVRRCYSITKVDKLEMNPTSFMEDCEKKFGLPFYVLNDNFDRYCSTPASGSYETLLNKLLDWIRKDYLHKMKKKKTRERIETKVWYNK